MKDCLVFTFHREGCTIAMCEDGKCQEIARLSTFDLLRQLPIDPNKLFSFMEHGTNAYLYTSMEMKHAQVPEVFYQAFEEKKD